MEYRKKYEDDGDGKRKKVVQGADQGKPFLVNIFYHEVLMWQHEGTNRTAHRNGKVHERVGKVLLQVIIQCIGNEGRKIKEHEIETNIQTVTDKKQQHSERSNEHGTCEVVM